jgi:hypothetical protein
VATANTILVQPGYFQWALPLIWLTVAVSCIVFFEPAPYDLLAIVLFALLFALKLRVPREIGVAGFLLGLFVLGNLVGALMSSDPATTIRPLVTRTYMVLTWLLFVSIIVANFEAVIRVIWNGYIVAALFAAIWGSLEYYDMLPGGMVGDAFGRAKGPFKDANVYGPFLVPVALYMISRMFHARGIELLLWAAKFLFIAFGLLLSFSRGAWINFALAFGLYVIFSIGTAETLREKTRLVFTILVLGFAAAVTLSWAINNTAAGQQFFDRAQIFKAYDVETGGRFDTQSMALQAVGQRPLGIGPGMSTPEFGMEPHNLYLHTAIEGGWIGGIAFDLFLLLTVVRGFSRVGLRWKYQSDLHVVLAVVVGTLFQSLFIDSTHWRHLWLLLAMLWALTIAVDRLRYEQRNNVMLNDLLPASRSD